MIRLHQDICIRNRAAVIAIFSALVFFLIPELSFAAPDYGSVEGAYSSFESFLTNVGTYMNLVAAPGSNAAKFIEAEFIALLIFRLIVELAKWIFERADIVDVFSVIILGAMVRIFMDFYDQITSILLSWSGDVGGAIQYPIVGSDDVFFAVSYISNLVNSISLPDISIFKAIKLVLLIAFSQIAIWLLSIMAFFAMAWSVYGFALAKLIGWFFIPLVMLERTATLFDGWLRYLVGFLIYGIIARVNIVLVLILLASYFDIPIASIAAGNAVPHAITLNGGNFSQFAGIVSLLIVSIFGLISTGKFAMAIAGGVGGFGGVAAGIAFGATRLARGAAKAV